MSVKIDFTGKRVALIGAGVSNMPQIPYIISHGGEVTLREKKSETELGEKVSEIKALGARLVCGEEYLKNLNEDIIIRSPGIRPDIPEFTASVGKVTCEMELFCENSPAKVFAVTGSDGKSTTTTILSKLVCAKGKTYLGGNIGEPLFHKIDEMTEDDAAVVELSSFQLMNMDARFTAAIITNVTPNHLNWHTGMDEYIEAKRNILKSTSLAVLNFDCPVTRGIGEELLGEGKTPVAYFSLSEIPDDMLKKLHRAVYTKDGEIVICDAQKKQSLMKTADIVLPGKHNIANYMAAIAAAWEHTTVDTIRSVAENFGGVRHRLQLVENKNGVRFYNSSIDSSPTRTAAAVSALLDSTPERPVVIICGGYDKNIPFEPLAETLLTSENIKSVVLTGATADKIFDCIKSHPMYETAKVSFNTKYDFTEAVKLAASLAERGDSVLLSPACASFDAFPNFEVRGNRFAEIVKEL